MCILQLSNLMSLMGLNSLDWKRVVEVQPGGAVGGGPGPDPVVDGLPQDGAAHAAAAGAGGVPGQGPARPGPPGQGDVARAGVVAPRRRLIVLAAQRLLLDGADRCEVGGGEGGGVVAAHRPRLLRPLMRQRQGAGTGERTLLRHNSRVTQVFVNLSKKLFLVDLG